MGLDETEQYLLVVSHSGRGLFRTSDWIRIGRDYEIIYPEEGAIEGIGPLASRPVEVRERSGEAEVRIALSGRPEILVGSSDGIEVLA